MRCSDVHPLTPPQSRIRSACQWCRKWRCRSPGQRRSASGDTASVPRHIPRYSCQTGTACVRKALAPTSVTVVRGDITVTVPERVIRSTQACAAWAIPGQAGRSKPTRGRDGQLFASPTHPRPRKNAAFSHRRPLADQATALYLQDIGATRQHSTVWVRRGVRRRHQRVATAILPLYRHPASAAPEPPEPDGRWKKDRQAEPTSPRLGRSGAGGAAVA